MSVADAGGHPSNPGFTASIAQQAYRSRPSSSSTTNGVGSAENG
jgi:hypothetical protein